MSRNNLTPAQARVQEFEYPPWIMTTRKSHILPSKCPSGIAGCPTGVGGSRCKICLYHDGLSLPHLPDMVFPDNVLRIEHATAKLGLEFNALDALKRVNDKEDSIKVAIAEAWKGARNGVEIDHKVSHPFDWTFTSDYRGTVFGNVAIAETDLRIDMEKLKEKERILFFDEIHLYEDELADHGCTSCSVKRAMPSGFFALHRFYLRVDDVLVRINDTRVYYERGNNYVLREYTCRESKAQDLKVPRVFWGDPNEISQHLPLISASYEKLQF
nr:EOG090X07SL [Leptodora kindtii]